MIVVQLVVATRWTTDFSLTRNTISDLGVVECAALCSPWHALMNGTFMVIGALLSLGALLVASTVAAGAHARTAAWALALLVVAGISSTAVGFVPLDVDPGLHALVATPVFITQPIALVLLGVVALRGAGGAGGGGRRPGALLLGCGVVALLGALAFGVTLTTGDDGALYERIALWPCNIAVGALGWTVLRNDRHPVWDTEA